MQEQQQKYRTSRAKFWLIFIIKYPEENLPYFLRVEAKYSENTILSYSYFFIRLLVIQK
jgi:hypothetical protein